MTLQERILEALGEKMLPARALRTILSGENPALVDHALTALMKVGAITFELGHYQRGKTRLQAPTELATTKGETTIVVSLDAKRRAHTPLVQIPAAELPRPCKVCEQVKPAIEFQMSNIPGAGRFKTCKKCLAAKTHARQIRPSAEPKERILTPPVVVEVAAKLTRRCRRCKQWKDLSKFCSAKGRICIACVRPAGRPAKNPAHSAAVPLRAAPFPEGTAAATVGAELPHKRPTFSPDLIARLVEEQRSLAMALQVALDRVGHMRQRLADVEELVRIATAREPA